MQTPPAQTGDRAVQAGTKSINNREQRSLQTRLATTRGNRPTKTGKKEKETEIYKARLQSQPQGPTAEPG